MLLQAKPEVLEDEERIEGGPVSLPLVNRAFSFPSLEKDSESESVDERKDPYSSSSGFLKYPWEIKKRQIKYSQSPRTLTELGVANQLRGLHLKAIKNFTKALSSDSKFIPAYKPLFSSLLVSGQVDEARRVLTRLSELLHDDVAVKHELLLFRLALEGSKSGIKDDLIELHDRNPSDAHIANSLGFYYLNFENDVLKAKELFEQAHVLDQDYAHPINNLGACLMRTQDTRGAVDVFLRAVAADKRYIQARENLVNAYITLKEFDKALVTLRSAINQNIQLSEYWRHQEGWLLIQLDRYDEAISWYEDRLVSEPLNPFLHNNLGFCYEQKRDAARAEKSYLKAQELSRVEIVRQGSRIDARLLLPFYNLGRLFIRLGRPKETKKIGHFLNGLNKEDQRAHYFLGAAALRADDIGEAEDELHKAILIDPEFLDSYIDLSFLYASITEEYAKAIELLAPLERKGVTEPLLLNNYCYALVQADELATAKKILAKYEKRSPTFKATKGLLALKEGDLVKAEHLYDEAAHLMGGHNAIVAQQHWLFERSKYLAQHEEKRVAIESLEEALKMPQSYITKKIKKLLTELKS